MFEINLVNTVAEISALSRMESLLNGVYYEINRSIVSLSEFTELEQEISELKEVSADVEREAGLIGRYTDSLDSILLLYSQCEKVICEEEYQTNIRFTRRMPEEIEVPDLLSQIEIDEAISY